MESERWFSKKVRSCIFTTGGELFLDTTQICCCRDAKAQRRDSKHPCCTFIARVCFLAGGRRGLVIRENTPQNWSPSGSSDVHQTRTGGNIIHILLLPIFSVLLPVSGERGHIKTICPPEFLLDPPSSSNPCREASGWGGVVGGCFLCRI